jgi:hypothetical protein
MLLQIFFKETQTLGETVDKIKQQCLIHTSNPATRPISQEKFEDGRYWYFSLRVDLQRDQIQNVLTNSGINHEVIAARHTDGEKIQFILKDANNDKVWHSGQLEMLRFKDDKLTAMPLMDSYPWVL